MSRLFCFGFGYCATHLAALLSADGDAAWQVAGTRREGDAENNIVAFDGASPMADPSALEGTTHLLLSIPPDGSGDPALAIHGDDLAALNSLEWIGYLSATSVYGDHDGGEVDEETPPEPGTERGKNRLIAERQWLEFGEANGIPVEVFRLAGIYGPGRSVFDQIKAGNVQRIKAPGILFSRIHVDDITRVLKASIDASAGGEIYNLADDESTESAEVVEFGFRLLGRLPPPMVPLEEAELSELGRGFYAESRCVGNKKIKELLGEPLKYPNYRKGLREVLNAM